MVGCLKDYRTTEKNKPVYKKKYLLKVIFLVQSLFNVRKQDISLVDLKPLKNWLIIDLKFKLLT